MGLNQAGCRPDIAGVGGVEVVGRVDAVDQERVLVERLPVYGNLRRTLHGGVHRKIAFPAEVHGRVDPQQVGQVGVAAGERRDELRIVADMSGLDFDLCRFDQDGDLDGFLLGRRLTLGTVRVGRFLVGSADGRRNQQPE